MTSPTEIDKVEGKGDHDAARRYDKAAHEFAASGKVEDAARQARPATPEEADELRRAEREGKSHSKGEDPGIETVREAGNEAGSAVGSEAGSEGGTPAKAP